MTGRMPALTCLLLASAVTLMLSACGSSKQSANELTLYNGQHEQTTSKLVAAFEKQSAIKVKVRSGNEAELANQILQEGPNSPADVYYSENTPPLEALQQKGLLAPVSQATLAAVPSKDSSAQNDWVGVSARVSLMIYNTAHRTPSQLPSTILELADPKWKGKLGYAPGETDFQPLLSAIIKTYGLSRAERWLEGIKANGRVYPDNETAVTQVNNGQSVFAPVNNYYWYRLRLELGASGVHSALKHFQAGDPGDLVNISGAATLKSSSHSAAAQAFLAFLVSSKAQDVIAHSDSFEYPLRPGVSPAAGLPSLSSLHPINLSPAQLSDSKTALALEQKLGLL
jgi:iron(III) transport system substrate-binding protein